MSEQSPLNNHQDQVTLYANAGERVTWPRGAGPILTGGRVGVMARGGAAQFQELEQWDVGRVTKTYTTGGQPVALRRDGALYFTYTDHLGSSSLLTTEQGQQVAGTRPDCLVIMPRGWYNARYNSGNRGQAWKNNRAIVQNAVFRRPSGS